MSESSQQSGETAARDRVAALLGKMNMRAAATIGVDVEQVEATIADRTAEVVAAKEPARAAARALLQAQQELPEQRTLAEASALTPDKLAAIAATRPPVITGIMI